MDQTKFVVVWKNFDDKDEYTTKYEFSLSDVSNHDTRENLKRLAKANQ